MLPAATCRESSRRSPADRAVSGREPCLEPAYRFELVSNHHTENTLPKIVQGFRRDVLDAGEPTEGDAAYQAVGNAEDPSTKESLSPPAGPTGRARPHRAE
jgi:hypothetical protein